VIPIATDQAARRTPTATIALIAANVLAYLAMLQAIRGNEEALEAFVLRWGLCREAFHWWQPVTYQFVHDAGSLWHLLGNMIFLWVFGSAVESRMRSWGFLALYLTGGVVAGLCQMAMSGVPLVGASGSVSAVTGAFIVLFPRARVAVLLFFTVVPVPALLMVAIYFLLDLFGAFGGGERGIGYVAHVSGTLYGLAVSMALIGLGAIKRTDMDMLYLLRQWKRRREMRAALGGSRAAVGPWASAGKDGAARVEKSVVGAAAAADELSPAARTRMAERMRQAARDSFAAGDFVRAVSGFEQALALAPEAKDADETRLMLAVIHVRKAPDATRARAALAAIGPGLPPQMQPLAAALRAELAGGAP
jgi:membrane associated rhomboid family serine protease